MKISIMSNEAFRLIPECDVDYALLTLWKNKDVYAGGSGFWDGKTQSIDIRFSEHVVKPKENIGEKEKVHVWNFGDDPCTDDVIIKALSIMHGFRFDEIKEAYNICGSLDKVVAACRFAARGGHSNLLKAMYEELKAGM